MLLKYSKKNSLDVQIQLLFKMIVYKTPTATAFHHRQQFHATQKIQGESISDWFKRLQNYVIKCEFEHISDYMLIDKFVSGLNEIDFEKISQVPKWTSEELVLVVIGNAHIFKNLPIKDDEQVVNDSFDVSPVEVKAECVIVSKLASYFR